MKQRTLFVIYTVIAAGVLGSGMMFNAIAGGGTVISTGNAVLPNGTPGTEGSLVEYRNLTLNKNIGTTNLNINGLYQMTCNFEDSSGIEYNLVPKSEIRNISLYNVKGAYVGEVSTRNFNPNKIASGTYIYKVHLKNGTNFPVKSNIMEGQMNIPKNIPADKIAVPKGKGGKTNYDIEVKITAPDNEFKAFCDTLTWYIPEAGNTSYEYPVHYLEFNPAPTFANYIQGNITDMMTGEAISNIPVKFVKVLEKSPFGEEFKFVFDVLSETTTDVNGFYRTPEAIAVQDSVFAMIGDKTDEWMDTEVPDFHYSDEGLIIPDSLDHDYNNIVYRKMDGFVSYLPMHETTDSLEIGRYGGKSVNYALFKNWENIAVKDTIPDNYIVATDVVLEQNDLGNPIDKLRNSYYIIGRENKCSAYVRNQEPQGVYFLPESVNSVLGFSDEQINRGKEWLLQSSMLEQGMTRDEAESYPDGFGGKYKILTEDPMITGYQDGLHVRDGPNLYHMANISDNPSEGYNIVAIDYGDYAETYLEPDNEEEAKVEMTSNIARDYTAYTSGLANTMTSGHKKVDQMFIPMETKFYQKQATGENNATMNELIGRFYGLDY